MEMHLFNAAKPLRMEKTYKAFIIDLKIPISTLTTEKLDDKTIKHLSILFRNFKINSKSTLWLYPTAEDVKTSSKVNQNHEIPNTDHPVLTHMRSDTINSQITVVTESDKNSISNMPSPHIESNNVINNAKNDSRECHMDYSLYEIDGSLIDFFQNINRFTLYYHSSGELDLMPELAIEEPCIDIYLMLSLKRIVISDSIHRDNLSEAVVKAITSKLRSSFIGPMQRILHTSSIKLNGPIMYNTISRCLATANSIRECVTIV